VKWDGAAEYFGAPDLIPLWIADMDFPSPPAVASALVERLSHPVLGYTLPDPNLRETIAAWYARNHSWHVRSEWVVTFPFGVKPAVTLAIAASEPAHGVATCTPVYGAFERMIRGAGAEVVAIPLIQVGQTWTFDLPELRNAFRAGRADKLLLCSPHNPLGRVWSHDELTDIATLCAEYGIAVVSDEVHCDLAHSPHRHLPFAQIADAAVECAVIHSASKTFNLAGLPASFAIVPNDKSRERLIARLKRAGFYEQSLLESIAMNAAFLHGDAWLNAVRRILRRNRDSVNRMLDRSALQVMTPEASFLAWIDFRDWSHDIQEITDALVYRARVGLSDGRAFLRDGQGRFRLNFACDESMLLEALSRLAKVFSKEGK
jgi:cysteine-S-conjugate beta-lyase